MMDNSRDKGYMSIRIEETENGYELNEMGFFKEPEKIDFYVEYEDGCIFIDWGDDSPKEVIGYYQAAKDGSAFAEVLDRTKSYVIGRVGNEQIIFRRKGDDIAAGRYIPEEECLAYYTQNGNITVLSALPFIGFINGSEIGGAAAFVAVFYAFNFKSVYRDFYEMDGDAFRKKHASYLNPLGL